MSLRHRFESGKPFNADEDDEEEVHWFRVRFFFFFSFLFLPLPYSHTLWSDDFRCQAPAPAAQPAKAAPKPAPVTEEAAPEAEEVVQRRAEPSHKPRPFTVQPVTAPPFRQWPFAFCPPPEASMPFSPAPLFTDPV